MSKELLLMTIVSAVMLSAGVASAPARAQAARLATAEEGAATAPAAETSDLQEVTVTARRVEENEQRVPVAVTTLSADALTSRNVEQTYDLQFSVPNMQIKPSNNYPSVPEFIIRGQRQQLFTDENVVTYVNGVPQGTRGLTFYDLDSVQVLKGPQGTLFGKNSNGGAVILTSKKPSGDLDASLDVDFGNYALKKATGMLNLPLVTDTVSLRFAGQIERRNGVFRNAYPGGRDLDDRHDQSGRITLLVNPTSKLQSLTTIDGLQRYEIPTPYVLEAVPTNDTGFGALIASLNQQALAQLTALSGATPSMQGTNLVRQGNPFYVRTPTGIGTTVPSGHYNPIATFGTQVDDYGIANNTSYILNDHFTVRNIAGFRYERGTDQQDPSATAGFDVNIAPVLTLLGAPGLPSYFPGRVVNNNTNYFNRYRTFTEELQLLGTLPHDTFIAGAFYSHDDHVYAVNSTFSIGPADLYVAGPRHGGDDITTVSRAIFGQATHDFGAIGLDALSLTAGIRYTWDHKDYLASNFYSNGAEQTLQSFSGGNQVCNELNGSGASGTGVNTANQCYMYGSRTYKAPTWTVSLGYQLDAQTLLYFTTRRGFKAGSSNPTTVNHDFALFGSEYLTDFELGVKNQGHLGPMPYRIDLDAFVGKYKDIQTQDILQFCATVACTGTYTDLIIFNVGHATIKGVELEAALKPVPSLELDLGYSYQKTQYDAGSVIPQPLTAGPVGPSNPVDYNSGQVLTGQPFPGIPQHNLTLAASYTLGFIPTSFASTVLSANFAYRSDTTSSEATGVYKTPAFGVANARLAFGELAGSKVSVALWVSNIADRAYPLACSDNLTSLGYAGCKWGEPRTYGVTATARLK